jgi:hypothetical protein
MDTADESSLERYKGGFMKLRLSMMLATVAIATASAYASGATRLRTKSVIIESPLTSPALAIRSGEAMYLHATGDGRSLLYVETEGGYSLSVLDVSNPAKIHAVTLAPASVKGTFDFVQDVGENQVLIRFRDSSQVALLNLAKSTHPVIVELPLHEEAGGVEAVGRTALLVATSKSPVLPVPNLQTYYVLDTSAASGPVLLAKIPAVKQRLAKQDTGTLFLLNEDGVTVVRRPGVEEAEHDAENYGN